MQEQSNILVVDDEHGIRITLAGILEDEGYNVIVAENGYQ
jgi:two-component system nitrogen regulation response regulator NtrX